MATSFARSAPHATPLSADPFERLLADAAAVMLAAARVAIKRGYAAWGRVPPLTGTHLTAILGAPVPSPVILLGRRGDRRHRTLGTIWVAALIATAAVSLFVHTSGPGRFNLIQLLSVWVLIQVPLLWWSARPHIVARHRGGGVQAMVLRAPLIAAFFTSPLQRLLGLRLSA